MLKCKVLIVDDEENVCKLLQKVLKKEGYEAFLARNGEEAIQIIDREPIDIMITDLKMPGMSGIELLAATREIDPSIKVIMITAFATVETAVEALKVGAVDYITKPFNLDDVILAVKKIRDSKEEKQSFMENMQRGNNDIRQYLESKSEEMIAVIDLLKQVADSKATVLLSGETGTGKEVAAKILHDLSSRKEKPFIKVNCAAIPEQLLESELFGYEKGAFTGAATTKPGKFELAHEGSIFLDEIGDVSLGVQVKLLRILQEREFEHLGGIKTLRVDVRVIAATNKNLMELVREGKFREDLYYRLNVVPVQLPPLRHRKEDIPDLAKSFLLKSSFISGKREKSLTESALDILKSYNWPGNIRELENIIERCVVVTQGEVIGDKDLPSYMVNVKEAEENRTSRSKLDVAVDNTEKEIIVKALKEHAGNRTKASEKLGISRRSLHRKIAKYNIDE